MSLATVILAAGKGTRMKSALPKVLHPLAGQPMVAHVVDAATAIGADSITVVYGHGGEQVKAALNVPALNWVEQKEQLGTGHAVLQAMPAVAEDTVLVLYGDVPLIQPETLKAFVGKVSGTSIALMTLTMEDPTGYGRIIRDANGKVLRNVEQKDASDEERQIREVNTGILACPAAFLKTVLPTLSSNNAQGEYYLTDVIALAVEAGMTVETCQPGAAWEVDGVNDRVQLARLERIWQRQQAERLMRNGATLADPARLDIRGNVQCGSDVFIDVNVVLEGEVVIGDNVTIGPNCLLQNAHIADGVTINANSVIEQAHLGTGCNVGPFARLRPGTELAAGARIGNFVETKKARIGAGSKVNHLTYIGDAIIGADVNVGAGTITCNYDGVNKFQTVLEDGVFIGSNSSLVAPVTVARNATVGAGSVVTRDVAEGELAVARGKQKNIPGWQRPVKKS